MQTTSLYVLFLLKAFDASICKLKLKLGVWSNGINSTYVPDKPQPHSPKTVLQFPEFFWQFGGLHYLFLLHH